MSEPSSDFSLITPRFDWCSASIPTSENNLLEAFLDMDGAKDFWACNGAPQYDNSIGIYRLCKDEFEHNQLHRPSDPRNKPLAVISFGGNQGAKPHVKATGDTTQRVVDVIRREWPIHSVSRLDSCYDMTKPGLFDKIAKVCDTIHETKGVHRTTFGFRSPENGRAYYLGSPKANMRVRSYEKGFQMGLGDHEDFKHWVRMECQYRPRTAEKALYATITPETLWGATAFSSDLIQSVLRKRPDPIARVPLMDRNEDEKLDWLLDNYWRLISTAGKDKVISLIERRFEDGRKSQTPTFERPSIH